MPRDGLPKLCLSLSILGLTLLSANMTITRVTPEAQVYQIQLLGKIMLVCPETFDRTSEDIDCQRWIRRTRGGNTVFVQPTLPPAPPPETTLPAEAALLSTGRDDGGVQVLSSSLRPRPRPTV